MISRNLRQKMIRISVKECIGWELYLCRMQQLPPVTVLMPAYNAAPYIREAIDSVLAQSFADFEFIIINDGSTDNTGDIIRSYKDSRIRVYEQENRGLIHTLNFGLAAASGKYIARFDADDVCYPDRLRIQMDFMTQHPGYVLVGSDADYMDEEGDFIFTFTCRDYEDEAIRASGFTYCPFIHASVVYLKQAVMDAGGYDPKAVTFEDHMLWRNLAASGKMKNLAQPLIRVRFNPSSVTIDEKWRGQAFIRLKQDSIRRGYLTEEEHGTLLTILRQQDFSGYKSAAYHSMIGKKYLWNRYLPARAREHLRKAISILPGKPEPYLLYLLSFLPERWIRALYKSVKKG